MTLDMRWCPFCGPEGTTNLATSTIGYSDVACFYGECWTCGAKGPIAESSGEALRKWDSRPMENIPYSAGRPINCS